uniref:Putative ovule protein n=1 Tax=Solanum chacoense TaxID=4108 RepID=A0A0V0GVA9_SOLCH
MRKGDKKITGSNLNLKKGGEARCTKLPLCEGSGEGPSTRDYCTQLYPAFLQEAVSTARTRDFRSHGSNFTSYAKAPLLCSSFE